MSKSNGQTRKECWDIFLSNRLSLTTETAEALVGLTSTALLFAFPHDLYSLFYMYEIVITISSHCISTYLFFSCRHVSAAHVARRVPLHRVGLQLLFRIDIYMCWKCMFLLLILDYCRVLYF